MYRFLAKFYPKKLREKYTNLLKYAGIRVNVDKFVGFMFVFVFLLALVITFYSALFFKIPFLITFIGLFFFFLF